MSKIPFLAITIWLMATSCNNNQAALQLQHIQDSLKSAQQQQQINNLTTTVGSMQSQQAIQQAKADSVARAKQITYQQQRRNYWTAMVMDMDKAIMIDKANLDNAKEFHVGRMPSTKEREINNAATALENDQATEKRYSDSLNKYQ